jgi:hypothetical protein
MLSTTPDLPVSEHQSTTMHVLTLYLNTQALPFSTSKPPSHKHAYITTQPRYTSCAHAKTARRAHKCLHVICSGACRVFRDMSHGVRRGDRWRWSWSAQLRLDTCSADYICEMLESSRVESLLGDGSCGSRFPRGWSMTSIFSVRSRVCSCGLVAGGR